MSNLKELLLSEIKKNRPTLADSSLKTYSSILSSLFKKLDGKNGLKFFTETKTIIQYLKDEPANKRKTLLSALFILTGIEEYKTLMLGDCKQVNDFNKQQKSTITQKESWVTPEAILEKYNQYLPIVEKMLSGKVILNEKVIIQFFLLALQSGIAGCPPRRSEDYGEMKIRNFNKTTDNYYQKDKFYFNKYKTAKIYGQVIFDMAAMASKLNILKKSP